MIHGATLKRLLDTLCDVRAFFVLFDKRRGDGGGPSPAIGWCDQALLDAAALNGRIIALDAAMRAYWFEHILADLDYEAPELVGDKRWAWQQHPWYDLLGLTYDECVTALQAPKVQP